MYTHFCNLHQNEIINLRILQSITFKRKVLRMHVIDLIQSSTISILEIIIKTSIYRVKGK